MRDDYKGIVRTAAEIRQAAEAARNAIAASVKKVGVAVGDWVQWTINGVEQFQTPAKVVKLLSEDYVQVEGPNKVWRNCGVPVNQITLVGICCACPNGHSIKAKPEWQGRMAACPRCKSTFQIPIR